MHPDYNYVSFEERDDKTGEEDALKMNISIEQVQELIDGGIPGLHFYVLNRSPATAAVLGNVRRP